MVLNETFGITGQAVAFFGAWWILGLFLILLFLMFLIAYNVSKEGIISYIIISLLVTSSYGLYVISEQIIQTIVLIVIMFVGYLFYMWVSR